MVSPANSIKDCEVFELTFLMFKTWDRKSLLPHNGADLHPGRNLSILGYTFDHKRSYNHTNARRAFLIRSEIVYLILAGVVP